MIEVTAQAVPGAKGCVAQLCEGRCRKRDGEMSANGEAYAGGAPQFRYVDPKWEAAVPLFSWGGLLSPLFWLVLIAGVSIPLLVPDQFARDNAVAAAFAQHVRAALLGVSRHADIESHASSTSFPHAALLSHAFMWAAMAALLAYSTVMSIVHWKNHIEWFFFVRPALQKRKIRLREIFFAILFWIGGAAVFSMVPGSASIIAKADLSSRVFFSLLTGIFIFQTQLFGSWLPLAVFLIRSTLKGTRFVQAREARSRMQRDEVFQCSN